MATAKLFSPLTEGIRKDSSGSPEGKKKELKEDIKQVNWFLCCREAISLKRKPFITGSIYIKSRDCNEWLCLTYRQQKMRFVAETLNNRAV